jgi:hypothetical protein
VGLLVTPFVILGVAAWSFLTLDRDARILRREVMAATQADWETKVQLSVGRVTVGAAGLILRGIEAEHVNEARDALAAVRSASVGVYERRGDPAQTDIRTLITRADRAMTSRGWSRLVAVGEKNESVLIYVPTDFSAKGPVDLCLAVLSGRELVVVSSTIEPSALLQLVDAKAGPEIRRKLLAFRR